MFEVDRQRDEDQPGKGGADAGLCREKCLPRTDHSGRTAELSVSVVGPHLPCLGNDRSCGPGPTEMTDFTSGILFAGPVQPVDEPSRELKHNLQTAGYLTVTAHRDQMDSVERA